MKALILTYYWPPAGGPGVQRWLKFVKYLPQFGIEPIIYTVKNPNYPIADHSLEEEIPKGITVLRQPIWEPNSFFGKKPNKKSAGFLDENPSLTGKVIQYIRANCFIPDARRFWIRPSVKYLNKYLKAQPVDVVITTGPPHSLHLIGLQLKETLDLKWIADFRDPWTDIDYFHKLPLTQKSLKKHRAQEHKVLKKADVVTVVGKTMAEAYRKYNENIHVITNGFDDPVDADQKPLDQKFSLVHIGSLNADRNHAVLWQALRELCLEVKTFGQDFELKLIGTITDEAKMDIQKHQLNSQTTFIPYLSHKTVVRHQMTAQVLLVLVNDVPNAKGILTGKIFEYLNAKRPIVAIGPTDGDLAEILAKTNAGSIVGFKDKNQLKKEILSLYNAYKNDGLKSSPKNISKYHRKNLTEKLSTVIKNII